MLASEPEKTKSCCGHIIVRAGGRPFHSRSGMYSQPQYGDMFSNLTASCDPVFWPIHVNVDRLWWEWQQLNPSATPVELDTSLHGITSCATRWMQRASATSMYAAHQLTLHLIGLNARSDASFQSRYRSENSRWNFAKPKSTCTGCRSYRVPVLSVLF